MFIAAHAFGQGAVIWVFISEIFPNRVRAQGRRWEARLTGSLLWALFLMPETKGVPLEAIQRKLGIE